MPSISNMMGLIDQMDSPYITVHQDRCQLVRNRHTDCLRCASVCTSGAIHYDEAAEQLILQPELCIGCGTCATICPTCCLEAHHPNDAEFSNLAQRAAELTGGTVTIACYQMLSKAAGLFDPEKVVRVECLGRVEETALTEFTALGYKVALVHGDCANCQHKTGRAMLERVMKTEEVLLDAWEQPNRIKVTEKFPSCVRKSENEEYDKSLREAFTVAKDEAKRAAGAAADYAVKSALGEELRTDRARRYVKVMDDGTLPHFLPDRRERLLNALASFGEPQDVLIETRLWGHVVIDTDLCQACRMCAVFCPTAALHKFDRPDGTMGVEHYPGDCIKCKCCENICPAHALYVSDEVFARDMLAGLVETYEMEPPAIQRNAPHTMWHIQQELHYTDQVYER